MTRSSRSPAVAVFLLAAALGLFGARGAAALLPSAPADEIDRALAAAAALEDRALAAKAFGRVGDAFDLYLQAAETLAPEASRPGEGREPDRFVSARAGVYLLVADYLAGRADRIEEARGRLDRLAERTSDPLLRARIDDLRRGYAQRMRDYDEAKRLTRSLGFVMDWLVIGPFDNDRGGGFATAHPPEREIDPAARYPGKRNEIGWRRVPVSDRSYVDLDTLLRPNDEALAYALTHVRSDSDREVSARFGTDESFQLFVNDRLVAARDARRPCRFDQDVAGFFLRKGWNRILLKLGERTGEWGFMLRLTTPDGEPIADLEVEPDPAAATPLAEEPGTDPSPEPRPGEIDVLSARLRSDAGDARTFHHLALLETLVHPKDDGSTAALDASREASRLEPSNTSYLFLQALASVRPASMSPEREENEKRRILERILEIDAKNAEAALTLALYYAQSLSNHEKAEALVKRALEANPGFVDAKLLLVRELRRLTFGPQADEDLRAFAADRKVAEEKTVALEVARMAISRRDFPAAEKTLRRLVDRDVADGGPRVELYRLYLATGRREEALALLLDSLDANPYDIGSRLVRADLLESADRLDEAALEVEAALAISPDDPAAVKKLAKLEHRRGRDAEALALFDRALMLDPNDRDLERYVEFLRVAKRPFEESYPIDRETAIARAAALPALGNESHASVLRRSLVKVNRDGTASRHEYRLFKVQNEEGVRALDRVPVVFAVGEQRVRVLANRVIRPDGTVRDGRTANASGDGRAGEYRTYAVRSIDLPPLEVGDVAEVEYRLDDSRQSFFGDYFGLRHLFRPEGDFGRVLESELILVHPEDRALRVRSVNGAPEPAAGPGDDAGFVSLRYRMTDLPRIEPEPYMPGFEEFAPMVEATTYRSWDDFAAWWWNLIRREIQMNEPMRESLARRTKDARTEEEMIRAVFDYVVTDIRYNAWEFGVHGYQPYNASTICARQFGDCKDKAIVIVTLLRELGIAAHPVVIHAGEPRPKEDLTLALVDHFNHCIAYAEPKGGSPVFLDGTAEFHDVSTLPDMDRGATVVVVRDGKPEIQVVPMPPPEENGHEVTYDVELKPDRRGAVVTARTRAWGTPAAAERRILHNPGRRREVIENLLIRDFGSARYVSSSVPDMTRLEREIEYSAIADVPEIVKRSGTGLALPATIRRISLAAFATSESRRFDLLLPTPSLRRRTVVYHLADGLEPGRLPSPVRLETPFGRFVMEATAEGIGGRTVRITTELALKAARVSPGDYPAFREFALAALRATEEAVPLVESH